MWLINYLYYKFAFTKEISVFIIFMFFVVAFSFALRVVPLTFLLRLVWWCWTLLAFACLWNFWSLHQMWMKALPGRLFLVVGFCLSSLQIYHVTPFWPPEVLLKSHLIALWGFLFMLFFAFPFLLLIFFLWI